MYNLINSTLIEDDYFKHDRFIVTPTTSIKDYNDHIKHSMSLISDATYKTILKHFGQKHSRDVYHIWFAERMTMDYILTHDKRLINNVVEQQKRN